MYIFAIALACFDVFTCTEVNSAEPSRASVNVPCETFNTRHRRCLPASKGPDNVVLQPHRLWLNIKPHSCRPHWHPSIIHPLSVQVFHLVGQQQGHLDASRLGLQQVDCVGGGGRLLGGVREQR